MIRVDISENFQMVVTLFDEINGQLVTGETVTYDVRDSSDNALIPAISGTMTESTVASGVYKTTINIPASGNYTFYASSSNFVTNTEEIVVNADNLYNLLKQNRHYNTSVQDVVRTEASPTASQTARNVPLGRTDYVVSYIKEEDDSDWSTATSGVVYAWYESTSSLTPYKMSDNGL